MLNFRIRHTLNRSFIRIFFNLHDCTFKFTEPILCYLLISVILSLNGEVPTDFKTKFVQRFSVLADVNYIFFVFITLCIHFWILQCIFVVKLSMSTSEKMYSQIIQIIATPPTRLGEIF